MKVLKRVKINAIVIAVLLCGFGTIFLLEPTKTSEAVCFLLAAFLGILAISYFVRFFRALKDTDYVGNEMSIGIAILIVAIFLFLQAKQFRNVVPIILGFLVVFDSTSKLQNSYYLKRADSNKWSSILILSLVNLLVGILLLWNPFFPLPQSLPKLMVALGIALLFSGVSDLVMIIVMVKEMKKQNEIMTVEEKEQ